MWVVSLPNADLTYERPRKGQRNGTKSVDQDSVLLQWYGEGRVWQGI